jgi:hypothetical protein
VRPSARKTSVPNIDFRMISTFWPSYVIAVETGKISIWKASGDALASAARISSALLSIPPGQQLVDPIDLVVGDAGKNIGQPCLRIDTIELGSMLRVSEQKLVRGRSTHSGHWLTCLGQKQTGPSPTIHNNTDGSDFLTNPSTSSSTART